MPTIAESLQRTRLDERLLRQNFIDTFLKLGTAVRQQEMAKRVASRFEPLIKEFEGKVPEHILGYARNVAGGLIEMASVPGVNPQVVLEGYNQLSQLLLTQGAMQMANKMITDLNQEFEKERAKVMEKLSLTNYNLDKMSVDKLIELYTQRTTSMLNLQQSYLQKLMDIYSKLGVDTSFLSDIIKQHNALGLAMIQEETDFLRNLVLLEKNKQVVETQLKKEEKEEQKKRKKEEQETLGKISRWKRDIEAKLNLLFGRGVNTSKIAEELISGKGRFVRDPQSGTLQYIGGETISIEPEEIVKRKTLGEEGVYEIIKEIDDRVGKIWEIIGGYSWNLYREPIQFIPAHSGKSSSSPIPQSLPGFTPDLSKSQPSKRK